MVLSASSSGRAISVSESVVRAVVPPEQTHWFSFEILNDDQADLRLALRIVDWLESEDGVTAILPPGTHARSAAPRMTLSDTEVTLLPGESAAITISATLDPAADGTYWAGCLVQEIVDSGAQDGPSMAVRRQLLVRLMYTTPNARGTARVVRVWSSGSNPITIHAEVENDGTAVLDVITSLFTAEDTEGRTVFESSSPSISLLPGFSAEISTPAPWTTDDSGTFLVRAVIDFGGDVLVAGQIVLRLQPLLLVPIGTHDAIPRDLDGDGWYEDVDGSGAFDFADIDVLSELLDDPGVVRNLRAFDFDNDGRITPLDVTGLLHQLGENRSQT